MKGISLRICILGCVEPLPTLLAQWECGANVITYRGARETIKSNTNVGEAFHPEIAKDVFFLRTGLVKTKHTAAWEGYDSGASLSCLFLFLTSLEWLQTPGQLLEPSRRLR